MNVAMQSPHLYNELARSRNESVVPRRHHEFLLPQAKRFSLRTAVTGIFRRQDKPQNQVPATTFRDESLRQGTL